MFLKRIFWNIIMSTSFENKNYLKFIYLKEYLEAYFIKHEFIFVCDNPENIFANGKFNRNTVTLTNVKLEKNIRFEDSCYPEYLYAILINSSSGNLMETIKATNKYLKGVDYPKPLIKYKLLQLFELILYRDFYTNSWWDKWAMDKCYVFKQNGELGYFTIYDSQNLLENLLNWVIISHQVVEVNSKKGYKLILQLSYN